MGHGEGTQAKRLVCPWRDAGATCIVFDYGSSEKTSVQRFKREGRLFRRRLPGAMVRSRVEEESSSGSELGYSSDEVWNVIFT